MPREQAAEGTDNHGADGCGPRPEGPPSISPGQRPGSPSPAMPSAPTGRNPTAWTMLRNSRKQEIRGVKVRFHGAGPQAMPRLYPQVWSRPRRDGVKGGGIGGRAQRRTVNPVSAAASFTDQSRPPWKKGDTRGDAGGNSVCIQMQVFSLQRHKMVMQSHQKGMQSHQLSMQRRKLSMRRRKKVMRSGQRVNAKTENGSAETGQIS